MKFRTAVDLGSAAAIIEPSDSNEPFVTVYGLDPQGVPTAVQFSGTDVCRAFAALLHDACWDAEAPPRDPNSDDIPF